MTQIKSSAIAAVIIVGAVTALSLGATLNADAQNQTTADPQQIKNYLTQAIQALDSGNNTMAAEQIGLAEEQLEGMTGTEVEDEDEEGEEEAGEVEDEDGPGEVETP
jgi:hypothetical protein